jgi:SAM-dependent methyltransferase
MTDLLPFTGHNIRLDDGTETCPGTPLIAENGITQAALRMMDVCRTDAFCKTRVADLGCLEGGYAAAFARAGYDVLGVEARRRNFARCEYVAGHLTTPSPLADLSFVKDDVRNLAAWGEFDVVFCAGLLYHLDEPDAFLQLLGKVTRRLLIVQTHFSLSPDTTHEGRRGHWYTDHCGEGDPWGSHGNDRSFWLAKADLLAAIRDAGFGLVLSQHDYLDDIAAGPSGTANPLNPCGGPDRGMFIGVKI